MEIESSLSKIFEDIDISWIDNTKNIKNSLQFQKIISIFPNLESIFQDGLHTNREEFHRTIKHIFRAFKIYFLLKEGNLIHKSLSLETINLISKRLKDQDLKKSLHLILILIYHDIGKFFDRKNHPHQSFLLILNNELLQPFRLLEEEELLISKVIQYHLIFATIYTGESTFYGVYSLFNDSMFVKLISNKENIEKFLDLLEIFTIIDILGYPYTEIYDHYLKYYNEIRTKLRNILECWPDKEKALMEAKKYSIDWLEWRIAGALRIFQFVETKPHLTKEFYFDKLKESVQNYTNKVIGSMNWELIRDQYLINTYKIQMKYSLALLMILAFGSFQRMGLKINAGISYKLILFWTLLSREIKNRSKESEYSPWNVFLEGMPHWSKIDKEFIERINDETIEKSIHNSKHEFNIDKKEFNLFLDFSKIMD
ncbi:MAG: hypothetical protein ACFE9Z_01485 [Promethearchaeota archaeon]